MVSDYNFGADQFDSAAVNRGSPGTPEHQALNHYASYVDLFQLGDLTSFLDKFEFPLTHQKEAHKKVNMAQSYFGIYQA